MGSRNPDRVPISYRRRRCESVGDMIGQGWDVHSKCQACQNLFRVNLKLIAKVKGGGLQPLEPARTVQAAGLHGLHGVPGQGAGHDLARAAGRAVAGGEGSRETG